MDATDNGTTVSQRKRAAPSGLARAQLLQLASIARVTVRATPWQPGRALLHTLRRPRARVSVVVARDRRRLRSRQQRVGGAAAWRR